MSLARVPPARPRIRKDSGSVDEVLVNFFIVGSQTSFIRPPVWVRMPVEIYTEPEFFITRSRPLNRDSASSRTRGPNTLLIHENSNNHLFRAGPAGRSACKTCRKERLWSCAKPGFF